MSLLTSLAIFATKKAIEKAIENKLDASSGDATQKGPATMDMGRNDNNAMLEHLARNMTEGQVADSIATLLMASPATSGMLPGMATGQVAYGQPQVGGPLQRLFEKIGAGMEGRQDKRDDRRDDRREDRWEDKGEKRGWGPGGPAAPAPTNPPVQFNGQVPAQVGMVSHSVGQFVPANQSGLWEGKRVYNILPMGRKTIAFGTGEDFDNQPARDCVLRDAVFVVETEDPADFEESVMADLSITNLEVGADPLFVTGAGSTEAPLSMLSSAYSQYINGYVVPNRQNVKVTIFNASVATDHDVCGGFWVELVSQVR